MDTITDRLERLHAEAIQKAEANEKVRAARAAENRRLFPTAAEAMDKFACFSPRVLYAREGGRELGKRPSWHGEVFTNRNPSAKVSKVGLTGGRNDTARKDGLLSIEF